ncbi:unnamed protein product, partial [Notodromas monacha]
MLAFVKPETQQKEHLLSNEALLSNVFSSWPDQKCEGLHKSLDFLLNPKKYFITCKLIKLLQQAHLSDPEVKAEKNGLYQVDDLLGPPMIAILQNPEGSARHSKISLISTFGNPKRFKRSVMDPFVSRLRQTALPTGMLPTTTT